MKVIALPKGEGKTTELIKIASDGFYYMVVHSGDEAARVQKMAQSMGLDIPFPLTYNEFINKGYNRTGIRGFVIDNVDMLLQYISSVPIQAITLTTPPVE